VAADPYRYFRVEARELVDSLSQGVLELEGGTADPSVLARLFRHAHTLKGAARVVRRLDIAELSHALEEVLARARDGARAPSAAELAELFALIDRLSAAVAELDAPKAPSVVPAAEAPLAPARAAASDEGLQTTRIEIEEMDAVLGAITQTGVELAALRRELARLHELTAVAQRLANRLERAAPGRPSPASEPSLAGDLKLGLERATGRLEQGVARVEKELSDVRDGADRLRLVAAEGLFPALARAVRDAAHARGRRAQLEASGGALRLDAQVLGPLRDALLQLVRNAVAHGIESAAERVSAGKPELGRVRLRVARRGDQVVFTCEDDGRGVDVPAVRRELVARGLASDQEQRALSDDAVLSRLFSARLSTAASTTQLSGRGVGLDVVRDTAARLHGQVTMTSVLGRGTSVELAVPTTLSALQALVLETGGAEAAIPLDAVEQTLRVAGSGIVRSGEGEAIAHGGEVIPFVRLSRVLELREQPERGAALSVLVVAAAERRVAVGVERLLGTAEIVVRPLPPAVHAEAVVAGASLDAEGNPRLVLDAEGLVKAASAASAAPAPLADTAGTARLPILVIDDSLTTRMLEQSILESAGYDVELATSAEEALEKAARTRYCLFVVDVEMPGMDGFEFVARTRAHPELGRVPAILVTSRGAPEDLARGERAGASAYIVKGESDQNVLLEKIRELLEAS
jgi:two-component system chemotaxis sensor kinase CheA